MRAAWLRSAAHAAGTLLIVIVGKRLAARAAAPRRSTSRPPPIKAKPRPRLRSTSGSCSPRMIQMVRSVRPKRWSKTSHRDPVKLHLLNVQPAARREVGAFVGKKGIADYHHEQGLAALNRYARSSIAPAYPTPYTSALATCRR